MNAKIILWGMATLIALPLFSAPPAPQKDSLNSTLNQLKTNLSTLRNTVQNHETEIRTFEQKLETQESNFDSLQEKFSAQFENQQTAIQNSNVHFESTLSTLESTLNNLINDLRLIKQQGNESVDVFAQYKQKLLEMEKALDLQNQQIESQKLQINQLESAIKSLMALIQVRDSAPLPVSANSPVSNSGSYKVQAGDTLEKIARKNNVSLKALKEINHLADDRIKVGQNLVLPQ